MYNKLLLQVVGLNDIGIQPEQRLFLVPIDLLDKELDQELDLDKAHFLRENHLSLYPKN
jgi:hypothetical protein